MESEDRRTFADRTKLIPRSTQLQQRTLVRIELLALVYVYLGPRIVRNLLQGWRRREVAVSARYEMRVRIGQRSVVFVAISFFWRRGEFEAIR